jgi:hypothetical protein
MPWILRFAIGSLLLFVSWQCDRAIEINRQKNWRYVTTTPAIGNRSNSSPDFDDCHDEALCFCSK